ncbi:UNVERIFIED_CONTAM: hypothetical protein Slati_3969600 [Sesamum latifolium]|uniref:CCHC-type domain-containing protein n=1 Tax=Sesamum latifolium TaxID=2727402 RepID=A0AAW2TPP8_9LAMI
MKKLPSEAFNIIDEIATNLYSYGQERADKRTVAIHNIDVVSALSAQMTALTQTVNNFGAIMWNSAPIGHCGACGQMGHWSQGCKVGNQFSIHEDVNFVSHDDRSNFNSYSNTYNPRWHSHPNFSWSANQQHPIPKSRGTPPKSRSIAAKFGSANGAIGASIILMPYSIFAKLGMHELTPTIVTLQLADRSIKYPRGIVEDVLVKVEKFVIPVDFIVLDMEEDKNMPLVLGRPFLATSRALIDVQKGQLTLRVIGEHVVFNVFRLMKYLHKKEYDIFAIDSINIPGTNNAHLVKCDDPTGDCIENSNGDNLQEMNEEQEEV